MGILGLSCLSLAVDLVDALDSLLVVEGVSDSSSDDRELEGLGCCFCWYLVLYQVRLMVRLKVYL